MKGRGEVGRGLWLKGNTRQRSEARESETGGQSPGGSKQGQDTRLRQLGKRGSCVFQEDSGLYFILLRSSLFAKDMVVRRQNHGFLPLGGGKDGVLE